MIMIKYKRFSRKTNMGSGDQINIVPGNTITDKEIATEIESGLGIPAIRTMSVLEAVGGLIARKLADGCIINLKSMGHIRASLALNESGEPEIKKVIFQPNSKLKGRFKLAKFEEVK